MTSWKRRDFLSSAAVGIGISTLLSGCSILGSSVEIDVQNEDIQQHQIEITASYEGGEEIFSESTGIDPNEAISYEKALPSVEEENPYYVNLSLENGVSKEVSPDMPSVTGIWFVIESEDVIDGGTEAP